MIHIDSQDKLAAFGTFMFLLGWVVGYLVMGR